MSFDKSIPGKSRDETRTAAEQVSEQFLLWFGKAPVAAIVTSLQPGYEHRYLAVNDAYLQLTGYSGREVTGRDFLGDVHPADQQAVEEAVGQLTAGLEDRLELRPRLLMKAGDVVPARTASVHVRPGQENGYLLTFVEDLTGSEQVQAELRGLELRLARSSRLESLGYLVRGFAHDFNEMLTVIGNYTSLVYDELSVAEATESKTKWGPARWDLEKAEVAASRARHLIAHLLAFAERDESAPVVMSPGQIVSDLSVIMIEILGENIPLDIRAADDAWQVEVDRAQFEQSIVNVICNAREAMPNGGQVTVAIRNMEVPEGSAQAETASDEAVSELMGLAPGHYLNLSIADSGPGMDEATAAKAFEPFFTTRSKDKAAGLGLAGVRRFAAASGGNAFLRSEPGRGTTVTVLLPAAADCGRPPLAPELRARPAQAVSVLVADDEPAIRDVAHRVLSAAGYRVQTAASGPEALRLLQDEQIDLVLADVVMPGMNAHAFAAQAAELRPGARLLFMSGYQSRDQDDAQWPDAGVPILAKPFSRAGLLARVLDVLAERPAARRR